MSTEKDSPFLRRWHLYQGDEFKYTAIPIADCIRFIGRDPTSRKSILHSEYPSFLRDNDLREVKP